VSVNWKKVLAENPNYRLPEYWEVNESVVPVKNRDALRRNQDINYEMRNGGVGYVVAQKYGVSPSYVTQIMQRGFTKSENGEFYLSRSLIPGERLKKSERRKPLSSKQVSHGHKLSMQALLEALPEFAEEMYNLVRASEDRKPYAINLTPESFKGIALTSLKAHGWPSDVWPNCTPSKGYQSFRRWLKVLRDRVANEKNQLRKSVDQVKPPDYAQMPFDEIQIDWQTCDQFCRLTTECEGNVVDTRLDRCSLLVAFDVKTRCVLAWHLALTRHPTHEDILQVIDNIFTQRKRTIRFCPDLVHVPGSGYPSSVIPYMNMIGLNTISMDNAWANMAIDVAEKVCSLGGSLRFAKGRSPLERNFVEHFFYYINGLTHLPASSTGSHPNDPIRETAKNASKAPEISIQAMMELIDVWVSAYNREPKQHNGGESPLQRLERYSNTQPLRISHDMRHATRDLFVGFYPATIYVSKSGSGRPFIKHMGLEYRGNQLNDRSFHDKRVRVKKDKRDIRTLEVYTNQGQCLGTVYAQRAYLEQPLSAQTLRRIQAHIKRYGSLGPNPVYAYLRYIFINKGVPRMALEFLRLSEEIKNGDQLYIGESSEVDSTVFDDQPEYENVNVVPLNELMKQQNYGADNGSN